MVPFGSSDISHLSGLTPALASSTPGSIPCFARPWGAVLLVGASHPDVQGVICPFLTIWMAAQIAGPWVTELECVLGFPQKELKRAGACFLGMFESPGTESSWTPVNTCVSEPTEQAHATSLPARGRHVSLGSLQTIHQASLTSSQESWWVFPWVAFRVGGGKRAGDPRRDRLSRCGHIGAG